MTAGPVLGPAEGQRAWQTWGWGGAGETGPHGVHTVIALFFQGLGLRCLLISMPVAPILPSTATPSTSDSLWALSWLPGITAGHMESTAANCQAAAH